MILVSREHAYHGMNAFGTSLAGIPGNRAGYGGPIVEAVEHVPWNDTAALEQLLVDHGHRVAAFIGEPVIGAGGVIAPAEGYWAEVQRLCRRHDVLLIADEVITGFGRTGQLFGATTFGFQPDIITFAKGVTSGYVPLGGLFIGPKVRAPFWDEPTGAIFRHGYTYSGHAAAAAAAMANLDILEREGLVERVRRLAPTLESGLRELLDHPLVGEVRAIGLTGAVELTQDAISADAGIIDRLVVTARNNGVLTRNLRGRALQISPPFVIDESQIRPDGRRVAGWPERAGGRHRLALSPRPVTRARAAGPPPRGGLRSAPPVVAGSRERERRPAGHRRFRSGRRRSRRTRRR